MNKTNFTVAFMTSMLFWLLAAAIPLQAEQQVLFDFNKSFDLDTVITNDARITFSDGGTLRIKTGTKQNWPGITLKAPAGKWDLSKYEYITVDVKNIDTKPVRVYCRVDNPGADGSNNCVTESMASSFTRTGPAKRILSRS